MSSTIEQPGGDRYRTEPPYYLVFADSAWLNQDRDTRDAELREINDSLATVGWSLRREAAETHRGATESVVTALRLIPDKPIEHPAPTPEAALQALPNNALRRIWLDELVIHGFPAHRPHALGGGDLGRTPVAVLAEPPRRRSRPEMHGGRRPVIALFDTAIGGHPWLDNTAPGDPVWLDATDNALAHPLKLGPRAPKPREPSSSNELDSHFGHGTFSAGLVRQLAPDALILLIHVMDDDGLVHGDHLLNALGWIREGRTANGEALADQDPRPDIDVVCLPLGYEFESKDQKFADWLRRVLGQLGDSGVRVVASAGNDGTDRPTYPAAYAVAENLPTTPLVSVGALNPNGSRAHYSNYGEWVTDSAIGTTVVSTFPLLDTTASPPTIGGFSRWSGTSFAAAAFASMLGRALLTTGALVDLALTPDQRADIALSACRKQGSR